MPIFMKGIGANWLVCLGMFMGYTAKDTIGKCIGIWIPVMMFVTMGYEHSIANMFFIPAAIYTGADITWHDFLITNLVPSTLGNIVGGMLLVGCVYYYLFLKKGSRPTNNGQGNTLYRTDKKETKSVTEKQKEVVESEIFTAN